MSNTVEKIFGLTPDVIQAANVLGDGYITFLYHDLYARIFLVGGIFIVGSIFWIIGLKMVIKHYIKGGAK